MFVSSNGNYERMATPCTICEVVIKYTELELLYSYFLKYEYTDVEDWQNMQEWIKECLEKEGELL